MMYRNALLKELWLQLHQWIYLISVMILVSASLYAYKQHVIFPKVELLQQQKNEIKQKLTIQATQARNGEASVSSVEQMQHDLIQFAQSIPNKQQFSEFIGELFQLSEQSKLVLDRVKYQDKLDDKSGYLHYGVEFSVQGRYEQLKMFIHLLENSPRIFIVDQITLSDKRSKENRSMVNLRIKLTTLFSESAR